MEQIKQVRLGDVVKHRKKFITIDDTLEYKRCRVQLYAQGIVLRDTVKGTAIRTKQQQVCQLNDFVVAEMDAKFGGYGIIKTNLEGAIVSSHYFLFEIDTDHLLPEYLEFLSKTDVLQSQIKATGSTNYAAIRPYHVLEIEIPLPDLDTQKSIVSRLRELQALHAQANATLTRLQTDVKRLRQSILQQAIQGKLVDNTLPPGEKTGTELLADIRAEKERRAKEQGKKPDKPLPPVTEEEMPFELPEGWVWCRLGEICYQITDGTHQTPNYTTNGRIFLSAQNVKPFRFLPDKQQYVSEADFQAFIQNRKPEVDDVLVARIGAGIGEAAVIDREIEFAFYVSLGLVKPVKKFVNPHFIALLFNSSYGVKYSKSSIRSHGASAGNFNLERIRSFPFPLCSKQIQISTVNEAHSKLDQCTLIEKCISEVERRFNRLWQSEMQQIFKFESNGEASN